MNRSKRAAVNVATSVLQQVIAIVCGLITPRLILQSFGSTYNGVISSITQLLSMVSFLTLGFAGAVRAELYRSLARKDHEDISRVMKAATQYMRKVGGAVIIYAVILIWIYPLISHNDLSAAECALLICFIAVDTFSLYFFGSANYALLVADQRGYVQSLVASGITILNTVIIALIIHVGGNIFVVKAISALIYSMTPAGIALYVRHHYRLDTKCEPRKDALKKQGDAAIHSVANIIHDNTDTLILTLFLDAKLLSVYAVYYAVVGKIKTFVMQAGVGIEAAFGDMWARKEIDALRSRFRMYEYLISAFTTVVFSCIGVLIVAFVRLYTIRVTDVNYIRPDFALLITFAEAAFCIRHPYRSMVHATGMFKETKKAAMIEAAINLLLSIALVWKIGLNGVVIGTLVANVYRTLSYARFVSQNVLQRELSVALLRMLWTVATMTVCILASTPVIALNTVQGWLGWVIDGFISVIVASILTILSSLVFYKGDFKLLLGYIKRILIK